jgi:hypothetical protein
MTGVEALPDADSGIDHRVAAKHAAGPDDGRQLTRLRVSRRQADHDAEAEHHAVPKSDVRIKEWFAQGA